MIAVVVLASGAARSEGSFKGQLIDTASSIQVHKAKLGMNYETEIGLEMRPKGV